MDKLVEFGRGCASFNSTFYFCQLPPKKIPPSIPSLVFLFFFGSLTGTNFPMMGSNWSMSQVWATVGFWSANTTMGDQSIFLSSAWISSIEAFSKFIFFSLLPDSSRWTSSSSSFFTTKKLVAAVTKLWSVNTGQASTVTELTRSALLVNIRSRISFPWVAWSTSCIRLCFLATSHSLAACWRTWWPSLAIPCLWTWTGGTRKASVDLVQGSHQEV